MATHRVLLSPIDQLMPTSYIRLFLVVKISTNNPHAAVGYLQQGLTRTQQQFPYLGGTLFENLSRRIGIEWDDRVALQIKIVPHPSDFPSVADLEHAKYPFEQVWRIESQSAPFGSVEVVSGLPAIRITCLPLVGYLILGVSCFHNLWDIAGLSHFLHLWSNNTRAQDRIHLPIIENISSRDARLRQSLEHLGWNGVTSFQTNLEVLSSNVVTRLDTLTFDLDAVRLEELRRQLSLPAGKKISTNDLSIAVIWTCLSLNRFKQESRSLGAPRLRMLVDGRRYVFRSGGSKAPYVGNLALPLFASLDSASNVENTLPEEFMDLLLVAIDATTSTLKQASPSSFAEAITTLDSASDVSVIRESSALYNTGQLTSTSWSQAPMYVDFGASVGKVEYIRIAPDDYRLEGMLLTLPRKREGSQASRRIEIFVALQGWELTALQKSEVMQSLSFKESKTEVTDDLKTKL